MGTELRFEPCDPYSAAQPPGWADAMASAMLHQAWNWAVVHTTAALGRSRLIAGVFYDGDRPVGLATARFYRHAGLVDVDCPGTSALPGIALTGAVPASLHPDGTDPALLAAALAAFESALRNAYGRRVQAVLYRQIYRAELPVVARGAAFVREGAPVAVLHNRFADHDGYLRSLTKSRRVDQRRLARHIDADPGVAVWLGPATASGVDVDTFYALNLATARRNHHTRWPPLRYWRRDMFATVLALSEIDVIKYVDPAGELIAASLTYDHPLAPVLGPWAARPLGPDRRSGLWFDHLDRLLRKAIGAGRPLVIGGKGQAGLKAALGFEPHPQWSVVRRPAMAKGISAT